MAWNAATLLDSKMVASDIMSLRFSVEGWKRHKSGQHYDIRLTAPDGYQAERSYSIANSPEETGIVELGVQLLKDGEVSPYLFALKPGKQIEMKGPLGGHFIWDESMPGPLIMIGGGSGTVPFMSMIRYHAARAAENPSRPVELIVSARTLEKIPYRLELEELSQRVPNLRFRATITDSVPPGWQGLEGRLNAGILAELLGGYVGQMPMIYVCGPNPFVEAVTKALIAIGFIDHEIRTERFGG